nr:Orf2p [Saccharomyces cariocanus]AOT85164.1 Orf2p [Saccharomyces cariocanus]
MLSDYFYTYYFIDEVFNKKNIYLKSNFNKHKLNMYNTSTWKYNLMGFINTNNIKMLPIINNLIFIRNMHMNNKSLIKTNNKLYNNTLLNKIRDTTFMSMKHFKNWLSGFVVGDGYFGIKKNMTHSFNITLKKTDIITLENIKYYLNLTSKIYVDNKYNKVQLHTEKLSIIIEKIIPLFKEYPLLSNKYYSFEQWSKSAEMIYYNKDKSLANKFIMNKNLNKGLVLSNSKIPFNKMNKSFI